MSEFSDFEDEEGVEEPVLSDNEEAETEEEVIEENPLNSEMMASGLSLLCKSGNGLAHAYVRLDVHQKELSDISILQHFIHLRYIDISGNNIRDISPLSYLQQLLTVKADKNLLKSATLSELPYVQQLNFASNKITDMEGIAHPLLEVLNLNGNELTEINSLDPKKLFRLTTLELRSNKLISTAGVHLQNLKKLYLAENSITEIDGISRLEVLTTLHLRQNDISLLDGFSDQMKNLQYLNLRKNNITEFSEINKLQCLPMLRALVLRENPICFDESYRIEILVILRRLERLDQDVYADEERQEAEEIYNQRQEAQAAEEAPPEGAVEVIQSEEDED